MIVSAFWVPHCPAVIPEIGKEAQKLIPETLLWYRHMAEVFQEKEVQHLVIVSGQTAPAVKEFIVHEGSELTLDLGFFGNREATTIENNEEFLGHIVAKAKRDHIALRGINEVLDFGQAIPLHYLAQKGFLKPTTALHISHEGLSAHKAFGKALGEATQGETRIGVIISCDLSNKINKESTEYDPEARNWNKTFLKTLQGNLVKLNSLDSFVSEDVGGIYPMRAAKVLEGILSKYFYKAQQSYYEEAFGIGYGGVEYEILE